MEGTRLALVAMGDVWDETRAFVTREAALLLPLAMATLGLSYVLLGLVAPTRLDAATTGGAWVFMLAPCLLLTLFGNLAISTLVLVPRASVGEACWGALARFWRALLAMLLVSVAVMLATLAVAVVAGVLAVAGLGMLGQTVLVAILAAGALWVTVRLLPLVPLIAVGNPRGSPVTALRETLALTRGRTLPLAAMVLLYLVAFVLVSSALGVGLGSLMLLVGRLLGDAALGATLVMVLSAVVTSVLQAGWTVFVAVLARRLMAVRAA